MSAVKSEAKAIPTYRVKFPDALFRPVAGHGSCGGKGYVVGKRGEVPCVCIYTDPSELAETEAAIDASVRSIKQAFELERFRAEDGP